MPAEGPKLQEMVMQAAPVNIPVIYCNGFVNSVGISDMSVIMLLDAVPIMKLHLSYTTAKTLSIFLTQAVETLEKATSHNIMPSSEVEAGLRKLTKESK